MFVGQRIRWADGHIMVDQQKCIEELHEIVVDAKLKDDDECTATKHTEYRSVLGMLNWLQSRTQFVIGYKFSRAAAKASAPTYGDARNLNKVVRTVRAQPVVLRFWILRGK